MNNNEKQENQQKSNRTKHQILSSKERILFAVILILIGVIVLINTINTADFQPTVQYISHNSNANMFTENNTVSTATSKAPAESASASSSEQKQEQLQADQTTATSSVISTANDTNNEIVININTATLQQLMQIKGIGEVKAKAIIDYRTENGAFKTVDELLYVNGIGEKTLEKIRGNIAVK